MPARFVNLDRETPMLLPPDLRDWVAKDDLVRFVIDAVEMCELSKAKINHRGTGDAQFPPTMMLALLIYCYANRLFSSRQIEQATYHHVSVRYICGNLHPDHDTIATFRRENAGLLEDCFLAVLQLARELKAFGRLGTISVDGTKLDSRASRRSNRKSNELEEEIAELQQEIKGLIGEAERADGVPQEEKNTLAKTLQSKQDRCAALRVAKAQLEERQRAAHRDRLRQAKGIVSLDLEDPKDPGEGGAESQPGSDGSPSTETPPIAKRDAEMAINLVESDSRLMTNADGQFGQRYNAQFAVDAGEERSQFIFGSKLTNECNDRRSLPVGVKAVPQPFREEISGVLSDTGYDNADLIAAVENKFGVTVLCPPQQAEAPAPTKHRLTKVEQRRRELSEVMRERLKKPESKQLYRRRMASIEPVFSVIKNVMGFRRFRLFGLAKAQIELTLISVAYNLRRLTQMAAVGAI